MGFDIALLWKAPKVNSISKKAKSIPILNPINMHGRVFFFSWVGFMISFWAWYTFPPLLSVTIKDDLGLTPVQIANSNIVSLSATFLVRLLAGPLCDWYGPRKVFAALIFLGCFPVGLAPLIHNVTGLYVARFFIGILGATFVPCQVWCTGFFDKNIVGTANALAGGWGNAGGGITYFIMPAIFDSLVRNHRFTASIAWRMAFVVPLVCLIACAIGMLLLCPDTPTGRWDDRMRRISANILADQTVLLQSIRLPSGSRHIPIIISNPAVEENRTGNNENMAGDAPKPDDAQNRPADDENPPADDQNRPADNQRQALKRFFHVLKSLFQNVRFLPESVPDNPIESAKAEVIAKPTWTAALSVILSWQTVFHMATYGCSFGGELAINAILGAYFHNNFPGLDQTRASYYAAIFGFSNFVTRPLGGIIADLLYNSFGRNLWFKKVWITVCGIFTGAVLIAIGQFNPSEADVGSIKVLAGLIATLCFFMEAGNGANFALVPHVHPSANGILSGLTGACSNAGGAIFAVIFREMNNGQDFAKAFWVIGIIHIAMPAAHEPSPRRQDGYATWAVSDINTQQTRAPSADRIPIIIAVSPSGAHRYMVHFHFHDGQQGAGESAVDRNLLQRLQARHV
ncbi:hypothetical protein G7046_g4995 [Stylonectria norvegica]|nr:hypothetical protein G7046_g4995 [Stylonectria norvegica]